MKIYDTKFRYSAKIAFFVFAIAALALQAIPALAADQASESANAGSEYADTLHVVPVEIFARGLGPKAAMIPVPKGIKLSNSYAIVSADAGVSRVRSDEKVRKGIKKGGIIFEGDQIYVPGGSSVQIALDETLDNIVDVRGPADFEMLSINPNQIHLIRGRLFAVLDQFRYRRSFEVFTDNAVARATGTRFLVQADGAGTKFVVYEGSLWVNGREYSTGLSTFRFGAINEGHALEIGKNRSGEEESARAATYAESTAIDPVLRMLAKNRNMFTTRSKKAEWIQASRSKVGEELITEEASMVTQGGQSSALPKRRWINKNEGKYIY